MKLLRTIVSALCILAGAFSVVGGAVSTVAVDAVEDGTAVVGFTERALASDQVQDLLAATVTDEVGAWFADQGIDVDALGLTGSISLVFRTLVESDVFQDVVVAQAEETRQQVADALTDDSREPAPFVLVVEVDNLVAGQLEDLPVIGAIADQMDIAPLEVVVMDADTFESTRSAYRVMEWLAQYGLWIGVALVVIGLLVSPRRAWFLPKLLAAIGVMSLIAWLALTFLGADAIVAIIPGGDDGAVRTLVGGVLAEDTLADLTSRTLWVGVGSLAGAAVLSVVAAFLNKRW